MRTWILALVAAALPFALYFPLIEASAPGAGMAIDPEGRWMALAIVSAGALLLFAAAARFSGAAGPGLAAAIAYASFPSVAAKRRFHPCRSPPVPPACPTSLPKHPSVKARPRS